jgi:F-type H+-transporting ATPase subunit delta
MARDTVARRYAAALFLAAQRLEEIEVQEADARALQELLVLQPRLMTFLGSPEIRDDRKEALVRETFGGRVRPTVVAFLELLLRKHRIAHLPDVLEDFIARAEEARGIVSATVATAVPLDSDLSDALATRLGSLTGKRIRLLHEVDPDLLGGVVVTIGDRILDGSVKGRLEKIREDLLSARVL